jgi:rhodanese-related sulfurtransferase
MYFAYDAQLNGKVRPTRDQSPLQHPATPEIEALIEDGAVVLDVRDPDTYASGHLPGSLNIGLDGRFAEFAGSVIDPMTPILLCGDDEQITEARMRLSRIGYDQVVGAVPVKAGRAAAITQTKRLTSRELQDLQSNSSMVTLLDVRNPGELSDGVIEGSTHIPLGEFTQRVSEVPDGDEIVVYCAGGYRSSIAASVLRSALPEARVSDLIGGFSAWDDPQ